MIKYRKGYDIMLFDDIIESELGFIVEASSSSYLTNEKLYPSIEKVLSTQSGNTKFKSLVNHFVDRNTQKLHTPGPQYLIPFTDVDKDAFFKLFDITSTDVVKIVNEIITDIKKHQGSSSDFKLLKGNPIFWVLYCCIRYYTIHNDKKGLNNALIIYALSVYPSIFSKYFKYEVSNVAVMNYTIDNLSNKFIIKRTGNIFATLFYSINQSYEFLKKSITDGSDSEIIRFIQRIRNDQNSLIKKICDQYQKNFEKGNQLNIAKDVFDNNTVGDETQNNSTEVQTITERIILPLITNGVDLNRTTLAAKLAQINASDLRFYLNKIISDRNSKDISDFIESILFLYLYLEAKNPNEINSSGFLVWASKLFRKTNSNDKNIYRIKTTLDKWAEDSGVHAKFTREASRVNYKRAIYFYFILSIQAYN